MLSPRYRWQVAPLAPVTLFNSLPTCNRLVVQLLFNRGYRTPENIQGFLQGEDVRENDPFLLKGMDAAVARILEAVRNRECIGVFGDYDADGISAAAILREALDHLGAKVVVRLPHRVTDGYGITDQSIEALEAEGVGLLVTVDCGISAVGPVALAKQRGMDVIVTDHHQPPPELPAAHAIINPWLHDCQYPFPELCGAGLAYKLACALLTAVGLVGDAVSATLTELRAFAALATVADVVPLRSENRAIVTAGLAALRDTEHAGLCALMQVAGVDPATINSRSIGFALAPRLNAAGRMAHPRLAYDLLTTKDHARAQVLAAELQQLNQLRQQETKRLVADAQSQVEPAQQDEALLWVEGEDWPTGIIGLVAGKLSEEFGKPTLAVAVGDAEAIGSCRSIQGYDIAAALAARGDLMRRHGGHPQAAGFAVVNERRAALRDALQADARRLLEPTDLQPRLDIDCQVAAHKMDLNLLDEINVLSPFGASNPEPRFLSRSLALSGTRVVGTNHLRTTFALNGTSITGIGFHMADRARGLSQGQTLDVVYSLQENTWGGFSRLEFVLQDLQAANADQSSNGE
ncbi:MAG: single-stranded-DNA-specific exonuclease RecJ [Chloroflexi bacterium]|nr:single-stranded-DNA-specific exonuclease RecJ [Chloroflexota bacterium]